MAKSDRPMCFVEPNCLLEFRPSCDQLSEVEVGDAGHCVPSDKWFRVACCRRLSQDLFRDFCADGKVGGAISSSMMPGRTG
jgi:hypothetical protein